MPIQPQKCIGKYVTSHAKTFFTVSVRIAERTASETACEEASSLGGKKIRRGRKKKSGGGGKKKSGGGGKKKSGEQSEPLSAKKRIPRIALPLVTIPGACPQATSERTICIAIVNLFVLRYLKTTWFYMR